MIEDLLLIVLILLVAKIAFYKPKTDDAKLADLTERLKNSGDELQQAVDTNRPDNDTGTSKRDINIKQRRNK